VRAFLKDAESILQAAENAALATPEPANMTILIGPEGGIHILAESDWPLASLEAHHGARTLYRVNQGQGRVSVDGRSGNQRCHLEMEHPQAVACRLLDALYR
jgi:mannose-6-phosphate isomerase-like protein (cupin superfamily)